MAATRAVPVHLRRGSRDAGRRAAAVSSAERSHAFDVAIGSREGHGARRVGEPLIRHLAGRVFNYAVQQLTVRGIEDTQCGFKMFTASAVEAIFPLVQVDGWAFDIEVLCIARARGLRIVEVPIEWHYGRQSQLNLLRDGVAMFRELLRIRSRARSGAYDPRAASRLTPPQPRARDASIALGVLGLYLHSVRLVHEPARRAEPVQDRRRPGRSGAECLGALVECDDRSAHRAVVERAVLLSRATASPRSPSTFLACSLVRKPDLLADAQPADRLQPHALSDVAALGVRGVPPGRVPHAARGCRDSRRAWRGHSRRIACRSSGTCSRSRRTGCR